MQPLKTIAILFGGRSAEHEVSIMSARNVLKALDKTKFEPVLIGISRQGIWHLVDQERFLTLENLTECVAQSSLQAGLVPVPGGDGFELAPFGSPSGDRVKVDAVFPLLHGPFGEDGTMQGLLKLAGVPFVGPSVLGSALCMDKDTTKRVLAQSGVPVVPWRTVKDTAPTDTELDAIVAALGFPIFVKPANMGSSVGVTKATSKQELVKAVATAFSFDRSVLLEQFVNAREIECAVLGNSNPKASVLGEITTGEQHQFYSYSAKYFDNQGEKISIPAELPKDLTEQIRSAAVAAFKAVCCEGMARVDFFVCRDSGSYYLNEINTIPGFTNISMYPKLWGAAGINYTELITKLIELAVERYEAESKLRTIA